MRALVAVSLEAAAATVPMLILVVLGVHVSPARVRPIRLEAAHALDAAPTRLHLPKHEAVHVQLPPVLMALGVAARRRVDQVPRLGR